MHHFSTSNGVCIHNRSSFLIYSATLSIYSINCTHPNHSRKNAGQSINELKVAKKKPATETRKKNEMDSFHDDDEGVAYAIDDCGK